MAKKLKPSPTAFLKQPGTARKTRSYADKEVIYFQGDPAQGVFYIQSGLVKLTTSSKRQKKKAVVALLQEGDFFGEACLGSQIRRTSTAASIGGATITRLGSSTFRQAMKQDPVFADYFITYLLAQIDRLKDDLADHFLNSSDRRLARILLIHGGVTGESKDGQSVFQLSQTTLSEMVGTTRSRISFFMNGFRKKGYISYNGDLQIDSERLGAFLKD